MWHRIAIATMSVPTLVEDLISSFQMSESVGPLSREVTGK